ncbi:MAG: Acyl-coenzyme A synthetase/AMP-(fatty) acid ligase [Chloroflexi bacterium]|jgi:acyl-coenzyme A synthetase/AMP-(fatty) acid ligase|nr:MAG: Acyl-coenzyme A synthetase/AMP-(fatty) acid ligase [Chloroflexota bacterium]|tara:strand:+ start:4419 stop:5939 length:1521 start_codon:yes stop_codon:yes gene_type:complete
MSKNFNLTIECLEGWASDPSKSNKLALTFIDDNNEDSWTYQQLWEIINNIKQNIIKHVPEKQSKILIRLPHSAEYAFCFFAAILADRIPIPASPELTDQEINFLIQDSEARTIISEKTSNFSSKNINILSPLDLKITIKNHKNNYKSKSHQNDPAFMVYTSGTTSKPKGVIHAHRTILGRKMMKLGWENFKETDKVLHAGTLNWTYTLGVGLIDVWLAGGHAHLYSGKKEPLKLISLIEKYQITVFVAVPTVYRQILKYVDLNKYNLSNLRYGLCSGEPLPPTVLRDWQKRVKVNIYEALGMTELSTYISTNENIKIKPGSPGIPQPGRNVRIISEENNKNNESLAVNTPGLLAVHKSDPGLMLGYWKRDIEEQLVFRGEWFIGGDIASFDEDGYIWFHGRSDDIIKSFGYRVSPVEIETVIESLEEIAEAAVVGVNVNENKVLIGAAVIINQSIVFNETTIKDKLKEKLAQYKMPHLIREVNKIPRTRNGKIKRNSLKEQLKDLA